jgi:hypothetical protein
MSLTVKAILDSVLSESGLPVLEQYFGGSNLTLNALLNRSVKTLGQEDFSVMRTEGTLTMTTATAYALPTDLRYIVADTMQAQDLERFLVFPTTTSEWYYLKSRTTSSGIRFKARIVNGQIEFEEPQTGMVVIYEYLTKNIISSSGAASPDKELFTADTDTFLLDDDLLILDVKWRYKRETGVEGWQLDQRDYELYKDTHVAKEAGSGSLNMAGTSDVDVATPYYPLWQS